MTSLPPRAPFGRRSSVPAWLWALPLLSCCLLGFLPPIVIAAKARTRSAALWAVGFTAVFLLGFVMMGVQPDDADNLWTNLGASLVIGVGVGAACYAVVAGSRLDWTPSGAPVPTTAPFPPPVAPNEAAIADVLAARQKRAEARALAARDPQMARDLRIGRPDLPRHYDDGGLVDLNSAPAVAIATWLELSPAQAARIVEVRDRVDRYERVDDLMNLGGMEPADYDRTLERIILL